jgi:hypothetical protein
MAAKFYPRGRRANQAQLPPGSREFNIDGTNPLSNGLVCCYVPGLAGGINLTGQGFNLTLARASAGVTQEGPALVTAQGTAVGSSFSPGIPTGHPLVTSQQITLYWRGLLTTAVNPSALFGVNYDYTDLAPFHVYTISCSNTANKMRIGTNTGGGTPTVIDGPDSTSSITNGTFISVAATFNGTATGSAQFYYNGLADGASQALTAQWANLANTSLVCLSGESGGAGGTAQGTSCNIACIWTRLLSATELLALHRNPYQFLLGDELT